MYFEVFRIHLNYFYAHLYACVYKSELDSVQTEHSAELKLGVCITGHLLMNPIDFDECRMCSFFIGTLPPHKNNICPSQFQSNS